MSERLVNKNMKILKKLTRDELMIIKYQIEKYLLDIEKKCKRVFYTNKKPKKCKDCPFLDRNVINQKMYYSCKLEPLSHFYDIEIVQKGCNLQFIGQKEKQNE